MAGRFEYINYNDLIKEQQQSATKIQSNFRKYLEKRAYTQSKSAFVVIQTQINSKLPQDQRTSLNEVYLIMEKRS